MACCEIYVTDSGLYCCNIKNFVVKPGCVLTFKHAALPAVPVLMEVDNGVWIPADPAVISGDGCSTYIKPGEYMLDFDCATIHGTPAPAEGAISLCSECYCPDEGQWGAILSAQLTQICDKLVASSDTLAIAEIIAQLQAICDKLLGLAADFSAMIAAILSVVAQLEALCKKIEAGFADIVACLEDIKAELAAIATNLQAILAAVVAQTAILTSIQANQTGMSCEVPTHVTFCDPIADVVECCTGGATEATAKCFNVPVSILSGNSPNCTYKWNDQDLPNPYTQAQFMATMPGATIEIEGDSAKICAAEDVLTCFSSFCRVEGELIGSLTRICFVALPNTTEEVCEDFQRNWGKYDEPIGNILQTQLAVQEEMLAKLCEISEKLDCPPAEEGEEG